MKLSILKSFFDDEIESSKLIKELSSEVNEYRIKMPKLGSSVNTYVDEDSSFTFTYVHLTKLCQAYLKKEIDETFVYYILDLLLFSENVSIENKELGEIIERMTDPEINGDITEERVRIILESLTPDSP